MSKQDSKCNKLLLTPSNEKFGRGDSSAYWVLGDIFLQNYYSIYDLPNGKVGLIESRAGADTSGGGGSSESAKPNESWNQLYSSMTEGTTSDE